MTTDQDRLNALEEKLAHLEMFCEELNEVITAQDKTITYLKAKLNVNTAKLEEMEELARERGDGKDLSSAEMAAQEKPPHY